MLDRFRPKDRMFVVDNDGLTLGNGGALVCDTRKFFGVAFFRPRHSGPSQLEDFGSETKTAKQRCEIGSDIPPSRFPMLLLCVQE